MRAAAAVWPSVLIVSVGCLASPAALADPGRAIACDPPHDTPLRLTVTQYMWLADGKPATATVTRSLRFLRDAEGLVVEAQIAVLETDEAGQAGTRARDRMLIAYGAPGEVRIRVRLDAALAIRGVESLDRQWQDFRNRQQRLNTAMTQGEKPNPRTAMMLRTLDAMGDAERTAILSSFLEPVLHHCGTLAPVDAIIAPDGTRRIESRADSGGMSDIRHYGIDGRTGLLRTLDRRLTTPEAPLRPLRETWVLRPEN